MIKCNFLVIRVTFWNIRLTIKENRNLMIISNVIMMSWKEFWEHLERKHVYLLLDYCLSNEKKDLICIIWIMLNHSC